MIRLQRKDAACNHSACLRADATSSTRSPRTLLEKACMILLITFTFLVSLHPADTASLPVGDAQSHYEHHKEFEPYVEYVNEFTERRRLKTYFANEQSIFYGVQVGHVNVGRGNLTFGRRDLVEVGRLPLVVARVYDSSLNAGQDFGKGWHLSAAETIKIESDRSITLMTESATPVRFTVSGNGFIQVKPFPTDIADLRQVNPKHFQARLRTGFLKEFTLIGNLYRLTRVQDRNGNSVILEYRDGKLARIRGQNKRSINIERGRAGRIASIKDENGRRVSYEYNETGKLTKVTDLGDNPWRYEYNETGQLSRAVNPLGHTDMAVIYGERGMVAELQGAGLDYRYNYEAAGRTTVINSNEYVSEYVQNRDGITTAITNILGVKTSLALGERNNVEKLYRNDTLQAEMGYDGGGRLASLVKYSGQMQTRMDYMYDSTGRLAEIRSADDRVTLHYDEHGNLIEKLNRDGLIRYAYSAAGDLSMMNFGDAIVLHFEVDADG